MTTPGASPKIHIRDLESSDDLLQVKAVEKEVWGMGDEDSLPMTLAIACRAVGNIFVGAFDGDRLIGFAFGIFGREHGQTTIHSHMLAVLERYRQHNLGLKLKHAQRERALALGIREMRFGGIVGAAAREY
jgi:predicted GNAT superfamily acetyltransferase